MLSDLSPRQLELAEYMSFLSEQGFCADWMHGLEFDLWRAVTDGPYKYGHLEITDQMIDRLKELSSLCQGWIRFDDGREETFIAINDWLKIAKNKLS